MPKTVSAEMALLTPQILKLIKRETAASITRNVTQQYITQNVDLTGYLTGTEASVLYYPRLTIDSMLAGLTADSHTRLHSITDALDHSLPVGAADGDVLGVDGGALAMITPTYRGDTTFEQILTTSSLGRLHLKYLTMTNNITMATGKTVDGVDISAHAAADDAHHAPVTIGADLGLSGQELTILSNIPRKDAANVFTEDNTFPNVDINYDLEVGQYARIVALNLGTNENPAAGKVLDVRGTSQFRDSITILDATDDPVGYIDDEAVWSHNYTPGVGGYGMRLQWNGDGYIQNLHAGGTLSSVILEYETLSVVGGKLMVANGGSLSQDFLLPTGIGRTRAMHLENPQQGKAIIFSVGDHLWVKNMAKTITPTSDTGGGMYLFGPQLPWFPYAYPGEPSTLLDSWYTVLSVTDEGDHYSYTVRLEAHTPDVIGTYPTGTAVGSLGQEGDGVLLLEADNGGLTQMRVVKNPGDPWDGLTTTLTIGDMYSSTTGNVMQGIHIHADENDPTVGSFVFTDEEIGIVNMDYVSSMGSSFVSIGADDGLSMTRLVAPGTSDGGDGWAMALKTYVDQDDLSSDTTNMITFDFLPRPGLWGQTEVVSAIVAPWHESISVDLGWETEALESYNYYAPGSYFRLEAQGKWEYGTQYYIGTTDLVKEQVGPHSYIEFAGGDSDTSRGYIKATTGTFNVDSDFYVSGGDAVSISSTAEMWLRATERIEMTAPSISLKSIPTSDTGLATGELWNDSGTVKIKT